MQAKAQGVDLVGPGGLLNQITKRVLETALEAEMSEHLGYDKHEFVGRDGGNSRNGIRSKTVLTPDRAGIDVPRETDASFDPQIVKERQRRLTGIDQIVLSLTARVGPPGRSPRTSPKCTARRSPKTRSPRSPTWWWRR